MRIQSAGSIREIELLLAEIQRSFGFGYFSVYSIPSDVEGSLASCVYLTSTPRPFFERYDRLVFDPENPFLDRLRGLHWPVQWNLDEIIEQVRPQARAEFTALFRHFDITRGIYFPMMGASSLRYGISFAGNREALSEREVEQLNYLVIHVHCRIMTIRNLEKWGALGLTALERQCLEKAAQGYEATDMAKEMALSSRTVQYLVASLCRKMQVETIEHAVAKALRLGMIA